MNNNEILAAIAGVSVETFRKARFLCNVADEETKEKLRNDELSIDEAYDMLAGQVLKEAGHNLESLISYVRGENVDQSIIKEKLAHIRDSIEVLC